MAVTVPVVFTDATAALAVLHVPPETASVKVMAEPVQTVAGPLTVPAEGTRLTVSVAVVNAVPQVAVVEV